MLAEKEGWTGVIVEECKGNAIKLRKRAEQLLPVSGIYVGMLSAILPCVSSVVGFLLGSCSERSGNTQLSLPACLNVPTNARSFSFAALCIPLHQAHRVCLDTKNDLIHTKTQKQMVAAAKVLAGHFLWGESFFRLTGAMRRVTMLPFDC